MPRILELASRQDADALQNLMEMNEWCTPSALCAHTRGRTRADGWNVEVAAAPSIHMLSRLRERGLRHKPGRGREEEERP